jgi:hypothetical protein
MLCSTKAEVTVYIGGFFFFGVFKQEKVKVFGRWLMITSLNRKEMHDISKVDPVSIFTYNDRAHTLWDPIYKASLYH